MKNSIRGFVIVVILALFFGSACTNEPVKKKVGLQLWSLKDDVKEHGIAYVMEKVAELGYTNVELAGYRNGQIYGMEPKAFKALADEYGLVVSSTHVAHKMSGDAEADMAFWREAIAAHQVLGTKYMVMPILALKNTYPFQEDDPVTMEQVDAMCAYFNEVGKLAAEAGMQFGFHNHGHDHKHLIDGRPIYDLMLEKCDPEYVMFQMDVYWITDGGYDPVEYLNMYAGRFPIVHIKDKQAVGASGTIDFETIFEAAYAQGMKEYFVEVEEYIGTPMEDVKQSYEFLNNAAYVK